MNNKIAITTGDINGIGAEITTKALNTLKPPADKIFLIINANLGGVTLVPLTLIESL